MKQRDSSIDVLKGILILLVVLNHISGVARKVGVEDMTIDVLHVLRDLYVPFFMPAFFIVTGMCSSFSKPFSSFLITNLKTLIFPSIILTSLMSGEGQIRTYISIFISGGGQWFLCALFLSKLLYWVVSKLVESDIAKGWIMFVFLVGGILLADCNISNFWNYQQALAMAWFLHVGRWISKKQIDRWTLLILLTVYAVLLIMFLCMNIALPVIVNKIYISWRQIPIYCVLSISGTILLLHLSRKIGQSQILEFFGKESLIIYLVHLPILYFSTPRVFNIISSGSISNSFGIYMLLFVIALSFSSIIAYILRLKYLRWIKGKF